MSIALSDRLSQGAAELLRVPLRRSYDSSRLLPDAWSARLVVLLLVVAALAFPRISDVHGLSIAIAIGIGIIGAVATNLLIGVAGQASVGNSAFMAIGAFTAAQFARDYNWPFVASVLMAGVVAGAVGALVGIPAMRVRGLYLIIATLALHYLTVFVLTQYQSARAGYAGFVMPSVVIGGVSGVHVWYFILLGAAVLSLIAMRNLLNSRFGRAWASIARDEVASEVMGVRVRREKIVVFAFTSFVIGMQGALFGYYVGVVLIEPFDFDYAVTFVAMIVIGGLGSVGGSIWGALFVVGLPFALTALFQQLPPSLSNALTTRQFDLIQVIYGIAIVFFLVWERRGVVGVWNRLTHGISSWPLSTPLPLEDE